MTNYSGADSGFFLGGSALVSCSTSTPINHILVCFFCRIPVALENHRSSQGRGGGGAHLLHPPPRSAPATVTVYILSLPTIHMKYVVRYGGVIVGGNGHCPEVWTVIHSHVLKTEHRIMPGGWEGGSMTAL